MKNFKNDLGKNIFCVIASLFFIGCTSSSEQPEIDNFQSRITNDNKQSYDISFEDGERLLRVFLEKNANDFENTFVFINTSTDEEIFNLSYSFNNELDGWKYGEQAKAIAFANQLKGVNVSNNDLLTLDYMLNQSYTELFHLVKINNSDQELFSILAYLKSATASNLRMANSGLTQISGTINPSFLVGKNFFSFQEDTYVNIESIRNNIELVEAEASKTNLVQDLNLINYIKNSSENLVRFDELYSFYVPLDEFGDHMSDMAINSAGDCNDSCKVGCGTDLGCCGSYMGCCYYSSAFCLVHDMACSDCSAWHCGPACTPDGGNNRVVKVFGFSITQ